MLIPVVPKGSTDPKELHLIPAARIQYVTAPKRKNGPGEIVDLHGGHWDVQFNMLLAQYANPVVAALPAAAGTVLLFAEGHDAKNPYEPDDVDRYPILGWLVHADAAISPIIPGGYKNIGKGEEAILYPEGLVELGNGFFYPTYEDWFDNLKNGTLYPV